MATKLDTRLDTRLEEGFVMVAIFIFIALLSGFQGPSKQIQVASELDRAWRMAQSIQNPSWTQNRSIRDWATSTPLEAIQVSDAIPVGILALYVPASKSILVSSQFIHVPVSFLASVLIHEIRHAEGHYHNCSDGGRDWSQTQMGSWGVQIEALQRLGENQIAASMRLKVFCS